MNGIEKILVDEKVSAVAERELEHLLQESHLSVKTATLPHLSSDADAVETELWRESQLNRTVLTVRVPNLSTAISIINRYSSSHADCIVTNSYQESMQFASQVRSASIYVNSSSQFQRNAAHASEIALGMSPQRGLKSGRITLETLLTHKAIIKGYGNL